jgi:hypothetical protein
VLCSVAPVDKHALAFWHMCWLEFLVNIHLVSKSHRLMGPDVGAAQRKRKPLESPLSVLVCSQHSHTVIPRFLGSLGTKWKSPLLRLMNQSQLLEFVILLKHCEVVLVNSSGSSSKSFVGSISVTLSVGASALRGFWQPCTES